jgi:mercuric ion transport protein
MRDRTFIMTGAVGAVVAAVCCATPLLALVFGAVGITAWLAKADYVLIPALLLCLGLIGMGYSSMSLRECSCGSSR